MKFEEFLKPDLNETVATGEAEVTAEAEATSSVASEANAEVEAEAVELDVQKAVVESLAADKAQQDELINGLRRDNYRLTAEISALRLKLADAQAELGKVGDLLAKNSEGEGTSKLTLLERSAELPDRFEGETRDHVLEAIAAARDQAEAEGRCRKAQLLESVLLANEPNGTLERRRNELKKLFDENANVLTGPVIAELAKMGISHKHGEEYLLPSEIINRVY